MGRNSARDPLTQVLADFVEKLRTLREEDRLVENAEETFGSFAREVERRTGHDRRASPRLGQVDRRVLPIQE